MSLPLPPAFVAPGVRAASRWAFADDRDWVRTRRRQQRLTRWPGTPRTVTRRTTTLGGVPVEVGRPRVGDPRTAVLYLHGGGYTTGSPRTHRALTARLATTMAATLYSLDYRLAPEHPYPAAVNDVMSAYRALLDDGWPAERIVVAGDSAGGALALVCAMRARDEGTPLPAVLGLICPGADVGAEMLAGLATRSRDALLTKALVDRFAAAYGIGADADHPDLSPARGDLTGLPPMVIDAASDDLIVASARDLARRARAAGVTVRYLEHTGLWHVFHLLTGLLVAADQAVDEFAAALAAELPSEVEVA